MKIFLIIFAIFYSYPVYLCILRLAAMTTVLVILAILYLVIVCLCIYRWATMKMFLIIFAILFYVPVCIFCIALWFTSEDTIYSYSKRKPTEFFKIKEWEDEWEDSTEIFVVSNPPNDSLLLKKIVKEYNLQTMSVNAIYRRRIFYIERCLTRDYEEGKPYPSSCSVYYSFKSWPLSDGQNIRNHYATSDFLIETKGFDVYEFGPYFIKH